MSDSVPSIVLLNCEVDADGISDFRLLVNGKFVKYVTIDPGLYDSGDMCFGPSLISMLPPLPPGEWNEGYISRNQVDNRPCFTRTSQTRLPGITNLWHSLQIDHLELQIGEKLRSNVYKAKSRRFDSTIVVKFARFPWEIRYLNSETAAYEWIQGNQIGPPFLGHLTEEGRVIGFLMEWITDAQHAALEDLPLCQQTLARLHQLGLKHGDINKHNFLICEGRAILIDFDCCEPCEDEEFLEKESSELEKELRDTSGRGGMMVENGSA